MRNLFVGTALTIGLITANLTAQYADPNLTPEGKSLMQYFASIYGKKCVSGIWEDRMQNNVKSCSGKEAAMLGHDLCGWNASRYGDIYKRNLQNQMDMLKAHHNKGGIVQINWHWANPLTSGGDFDDTKEELSAVQWQNIITPGTAEYKTMIADLDWHANYLKQLTDLKIPVLWRPLHEIDGGWFWWTCESDPKKTATLWRIMYDYLVKQRNMHNLIWVYSTGMNTNVPGGSTDGDKVVTYRKGFYPGDTYVDIAGIDLYNWDYAVSGTHKYWDGTFSYTTFYNQMKLVAPGKMLALCEVQAIPNPDKMASGDPNFPKWLYCLPWWANTTENPCSWVKTTYAHAFVITLDELPPFGATSLLDHVSIVSRATAVNTPGTAFSLDGRVVPWHGQGSYPGRAHKVSISSWDTRSGKSVVELYRK